MEMVDSLITNYSLRVRLALVKADLIPQIISTLNPQSLSFAEAVDIHKYLMKSMRNFVWLATRIGLSQLKIEDGNEQQAVRETVFQQVLFPSEKYLWHWCMNRFSIIDGEQSAEFMDLLAFLLELSPYYLPAMKFVLNMPVALTIPS
ncbi:hypothetical protein BLNAU_14944 [Blattamonas nauphoetae]|uniref:Uncharacterized protein n=1 Tax=Blattamonas nauphoetae TaxID=2049346 RepID=A0ABQ9XHM6_9EUKA|nr:hypothetical protein BLNAU_14944 [Blattamonas nauphoetae]